MLSGLGPGGCRRLDYAIWVRSGAFPSQSVGCRRWIMLSRLGSGGCHRWIMLSRLGFEPF